jgi:hypothetical protein
MEADGHPHVHAASAVLSQQQQQRRIQCTAATWVSCLQEIIQLIELLGVTDMVAGGQITNCLELDDLAEALHSSSNVGEGAGLEVCTGSACAVPCEQARNEHKECKCTKRVRHLNVFAVLLVIVKTG